MITFKICKQHTLIHTNYKIVFKNKNKIILPDSIHFQWIKFYFSEEEKPRWSNWTYSSCSVTCGEGTKTATRSCLQGTCQGESFIRVPCQLDLCPGNDPKDSGI